MQIHNQMYVHSSIQPQLIDLKTICVCMDGYEYDLDTILVERVKIIIFLFVLRRHILSNTDSIPVATFSVYLDW